MTPVVLAFAFGTLLGTTGAGPIALMASLVAGAFLLWRQNGRRIEALEMTDELAGYDPRESVAEATRRIGMANIPEASE